MFTGIECVSAVKLAGIFSMVIASVSGNEERALRDVKMLGLFALLYN